MEVGKDLVAASASPLVLAILSEGESYGYAIAKRVAELSGGELVWTDGMLYPLLHRLERLGHIEARWATSDAGRKRKYYRLTEPGRQALATQWRQWVLVHGTLQNLVKRLATTVSPAPPAPTTPGPYPSGAGA